MLQKKVLVVLFEVPEEVRIYILPEDAPELPILRAIAFAGVHGNVGNVVDSLVNTGYYTNDDKKKALDLVKLFYANDEEDSDLAPMTKYRIESKTSAFTSQTSGDFSEVITLAFLL